MEGMDIEVGIEVVCRRCGHKWRYKGRGIYAKCSKCGYNNRVKEYSRTRGGGGIKVRCDRCGHEWIYRGKLNRALCWRCGRIVKVVRVKEERKEEEKEEKEEKEEEEKEEKEEEEKEKEKKEKEEKGKNEEKKEEKRKGSKKGIELYCSNCGYKWMYRGKGKTTECPNCRNKVKVRVGKCPICGEVVYGSEMGKCKCGAIVNLVSKLYCVRCGKKFNPVWDGEKWVMVHKC